MAGRSARCSGPDTEAHMPGKINAKWHKAHKMPTNPTPRPRLEWHVAHAKACACRPIPASLEEKPLRGLPCQARQIPRPSRGTLYRESNGPAGSLGAET